MTRNIAYKIIIVYVSAKPSNLINNLKEHRLRLVRIQEQKRWTDGIKVSDIVFKIIMCEFYYICDCSIIRAASSLGVRKSGARLMISISRCLRDLRFLL